jgi:hypothetical protein
MVPSRWNGIATLACATAALAVACGGEPQEAAAPEGGEAPAAEAPAEAPSEGVGPTWTAELPSEFPKDVPQYPDSEVRRAQGASEQGVSVTFTTDDDSEKVARYYEDTFAAEGWDTMRTPSKGGIMIFADKGSRRASALVTAEGDETIIQIIVLEMP